MDEVRAGVVTLEDWPVLVAGVAGRLQYALCFSVTAWAFDAFTAQEEWERWESGHLFGTELHLRWRRQADGVHVLGVGAVADLALPHRLKLNGDYEPCPTVYYLWGEWDAERDAWTQVRIPHKLHYPVTGHRGRVRLLVTEYVNRSTGQVEFIRYRGLKEVKQ